ncbi:hypothetical protein NQ318_017795 [Aromia moschata]|uniref:Uncharacterized protein n=1 Tax=Aromia moschata TaxID=1265417 RepID=A0AAV8XIA9_9CUCU|nr:hypothetical protein NQ318_017795 [Aromia moschata]
MEAAQLERQIKIYESKKQTLFRRIQRLYDWSKNLKDVQNLDNFKIMYGSLNDIRKEICELVDKINILHIERDPEYDPNFQSTLSNASFCIR